MATATAARPKAKPVPIPGDAARLVLFGMPDSGKSSLVGAVAQAARTQERLLHGKVESAQPEFEEARRRAYEEQPQPTADEVAPVVVAYHPIEHPGAVWPVALIDCDGRAAAEYLHHRHDVHDAARRGTLAGAVVNADALVLVVDASAHTDQFESDLRECAHFLTHLQRHRAADYAVGGLPVTIALSKCDMLAEKGDSYDDWLERVRRLKSDAFGRFRAFARKSGEAGAPVPFGSLDVKVRAVATRRPTIEGEPPAPAEPFSVAEFFRGTVGVAHDYRRRNFRSNVKLFWLLSTVGTFVGTLTLLALLAIVFNRATEEFPLEGKVRNYQSREGQTASQRLADGGLLRRLSELTELSKDKTFPQIPEDLRDYVNRRKAELEAYREYRDRLLAQRPPARLQSLREVEQLQALLSDTRMTVPEAYRDEWGQTEAVLLREKWLKDLTLLQGAVNTVGEWYDGLTREGGTLLYAGGVDGTWAADVGTLLRKAESPRERETDRVGDSVSLPSADGQALTYGTAYGFDAVERKRRDWQQTRERLVMLRDLCESLGMVGDPAAERAVFVLPRSNRDANIRDRARRRLDALQKFFPEYRQWSAAQVPDGTRGEVEKRLRAAYDQLVRDGHILISRRLAEVNPSGTETPGDWLKVADWLGTPALAEWRALFDAVQKLLDPTGLDPVLALSSFLRRGEFELELREIRVKLPAGLRPGAVRPTGKLTVSVRPAGGQWKTVTYRLPDPAPDRGGYYRFVVESGDPKPMVKQGDEFAMEMVLLEGNTELRLNWSEARTRTFAFEAIKDVPRIHAITETPAQGTRAPGVQVQTDPPLGLPEVPDLLPDLREVR